MRRPAYQLGSILACIGAVVVFGLAQEGHPLTGTWAGDWGPSSSQRNHITLVMNWDGQKVSGLMNPGPDSVPITVNVDYTKWIVRLEGDAKDQSGKPVRFSAEGRLEDIGSYHRKITGSWSQGATKGDFRITRD